MKQKPLSAQALYLLTLRRSEYSDEIARMNKKEELMLARRLKVFERQERVAQSLLSKHRREAEQLDRAVSERTNQSIDLRQYDAIRRLARSGNHGDAETTQPRPAVRLPALRSAPLVVAPPARRTYRRTHVGRWDVKIMSMRAMKTGVGPGTMASDGN